MKSKYIDQGLEVAFLCIYSNEEEWDKISKKEGLSDNNYYCNEEEVGLLKQLFEIQALPTYMLINRKGEIVEWGSYLMPLSPLTERRINESLLEK